MKLLIKFCMIGAVVLTLISLHYRCSRCSQVANENSIDNESDFDYTNDTASILNYYMIPSPNEIMNFLAKGELVYLPGLVSEIPRVQNIQTRRSLYLQMGILSADLAYLLVFRKNNESAIYFNALQELGYEVNLPVVATKSIIERAQKNRNNTDSLKRISDELYLRIIEHLESSSNNKNAAIITAGGIIESLYIATGMVKDFETSSELVNRIFQQKLIFNDLVSHLNQFESDPMVQTVIDDLSTLRQFFNDISVSGGVELTLNKKDSTLVIGGGEFEPKVEDYNKLRIIIVELREKWVKAL